MCDEYLYFLGENVNFSAKNYNLLNVDGGHILGANLCNNLACVDLELWLQDNKNATCDKTYCGNKWSLLCKWGNQILGGYEVLSLSHLSVYPVDFPW